MRNTSITLGTRYEAFTSAQVKSGRYASVSEVVRAGLRVLEEREARIQALRTALIDGENSGDAEYSLDGILQELEG